MATSTSEESNTVPSLSNIFVATKDGAYLKAEVLQDEAKLRLIFPLVKTAASDVKRKDRPFAEDEYFDEKDFVEYAGSGYVITFINSHSDQVEAYGFITPSLFHRIQRPFYAEIRLFTLDPDPSTEFLAALITALSDIAKSLSYMGAIIDILVCSCNQIQAARIAGYQDFLVVNMSGRIPQKGLIEALIFFKRFYSPDKPFPEPDDPSMQNLPEMHLRKFNRRPELQTFPIQTFLTDGTAVTIKYMSEKHIQVCQEFFNKAVERGQGFGPHEIPPKELLEGLVHREDVGHGIAAEIKGKTVGIMYLGPSIYCRSINPEVSDAYAIVDPTISSKGMATFFAQLWLKLSYLLGYKGCMTDTFLKNDPVLHILRVAHFTFLGTLWRGGHLQTKGFEDTMFFFRKTMKDDPQGCVLSKI